MGELNFELIKNENAEFSNNEIVLTNAFSCTLCLQILIKEDKVEKLTNNFEVIYDNDNSWITDKKNFIDINDKTHSNFIIYIDDNYTNQERYYYLSLRNNFNGEISTLIIKQPACNFRIDISPNEISFNENNKNEEQTVNIIIYGGEKIGLVDSKYIDIKFDNDILDYDNSLSFKMKEIKTYIVKDGKVTIGGKEYTVTDDKITINSTEYDQYVTVGVKETALENQQYDKNVYQINYVSELLKETYKNGFESKKVYKEGIDDNNINSVKNKFKLEFLKLVKETFWLTSETQPKDITITVQTKKLPIEYYLKYCPEENSDETEVNVLGANGNVYPDDDTEVYSVSDILIPTITNSDNENYGFDDVEDNHKDYAKNIKDGNISFGYDRENGYDKQRDEY